MLSEHGSRKWSFDAAHTWAASRKESGIAHRCTETETSEFKILTRSHTAGSPPASCEELTNIALSLPQPVGLRPHQRFRLVGVGLSNFCDPKDGPARLFLPNHTALSVRSLLSSPKNTDWLLHGSSGLRRPLSPARPRREHPQQRTCRQALYQACPPPSFAQEKRARGRS